MALNFTIEPKITKDYLLSQYSEETYMQYYLGVEVKKGLFCSPLRKDNNPTCSFYRNSSGELIFKDFNGSFYGNFISVVMTKYSVNYHQALKIIANDFGIIKRKNIQKHEGVIQVSTPKLNTSGHAKIQVEIKDFTKAELDWWNQYGITPQILKKYHVYSCKTVFLNGNISNTYDGKTLMFGYYGGMMQGNELWRIYFPGRHTFRFLTNWPAKKIQGYKQLSKTGKLLIITKSMKDVMCLRSLGINACAPNSENLFVSDSVLADLKTRFKYIVVFYDNDLAGIANMKKIKKEHPELVYFFIPRRFKAKDISDFHKKYGKKNTSKFIKKSILKYKQYE